VLVAHDNVLQAATAVYPQEAEALVFHPDGHGSDAVVARIPPPAWERLVAESSDR
jgi:hypothetical protein